MMSQECLGIRIRDLYWDGTLGLQCSRMDPVCMETFIDDMRNIGEFGERLFRCYNMY
jgi:hypothetical protein